MRYGPGFQSAHRLLLVLMLCFVIGCSGSGGGGDTGNAGGDNSAEQTASLSPVIGSFTCDPGLVAQGSNDTVLLSWDVAGADRIHITPDIGVVSVANGATTVQPTVTTQYTLFAVSSGGSDTASATVEVRAGQTAGANAFGDVPNGLPPRLAVGLVEEPGVTWMQDSGVAWDMRYHYFTKGWRNNWGWDSENNGSWGRRWMVECDAQGFIPAIQYYCMNDEPGGGEDQFYNKTTHTATMASYFDDFKVLMLRAKEFGKPVLVMLEADGFAYMERQANEDPDAYAAIAATQMPELSNLPDTVAGWGLAFLKIRKALGANNVILGMHISAWASGKDIAYFQTGAPLQPEVDKVYAFLSRLGLEDNVTGATYDLLVGDPLDRDADYYRLVQSQDRWWDPDDAAAIDSKSFNRYAEWMTLWNRKAEKRWVLWQIPLGNSHHLNVSNNGGPREGYRDNRTEYFFANGTSHMRKFADAGAIALLFGPGTGGQSYYTNDYDANGELFMKSRAGSILNDGGLSIAVSGL